MTPISTHIPSKYRCLEAGAVLSQGSKHVLIIRGAENHNKTSGNGGKWIIETEAGSMSCAEALRDWQITPAHEVSMTPQSISTKDQESIDGLIGGLKSNGDALIGEWERDSNSGVRALADRAKMFREMKKRPICSKCGKDLMGETHVKLGDGTLICHACG